MKDYSNYRPPAFETSNWSGIKLFEQQLRDSGEDVIINGVSTRAIIQTHTSPYNENKEDRKFLCPIDTDIDRGYIVDYDGNKWIVLSEVNDNNIYKFTKIQCCNNTLKFYNKDNESGILWILTEVPCIVTTPFKTNMGEDENKFLITSVTDYQVIVPDNDDTEIIDNGIRFLLKGKKKFRPFECEGYDDTSNPGIKTLKLSLTEFNSDDDRINGIADALKYQNIYSIQLLSNSIVDLNYLNQTSKIEVKCFANGIEDLSPILSIVNDNPYVCSVDNNTLTITGQGTGISNITINYHGQTINIVVNGTVTENHNYALSITGVDNIKVGQQNTYVANVTDNGDVYMVSPIIWELFADDGISSTTLASIISTSGTYNENIIIKANSSNQYGYMRLKAKTDTNSCNNVKRIQIKSFV